MVAIQAFVTFAQNLVQRAVGVRLKGALRQTACHHEQLHLHARSDKKFAEKDSIANCQPTILRVSPIR